LRRFDTTLALTTTNSNGTMPLMARRNLEEWFWQVSGDVLIVTVGSTPPTSHRRHFWEPKVDVFEGAEHFVIKAELSGVRQENLQLAYLPDRHSLLIRGVRNDEGLPGVGKANCHQLEIYYGEFEREIQLPDAPVEPEAMKAQYAAGMLFVLIPKARVRVQHTRVTIRQV
jgi:HSP20 family molecular chaperone IbpA